MAEKCKEIYDVVRVHMSLRRDELNSEIADMVQPDVWGNEVTLFVLSRYL